MERSPAVSGCCDEALGGSFRVLRCSALPPAAASGGDPLQQGWSQASIRPRACFSATVIYNVKQSCLKKKKSKTVNEGIVCHDPGPGHPGLGFSAATALQHKEMGCVLLCSITGE